MKFPQLKNHPQWDVTLQIVKTLQARGFEALLAGGAVRDLLLQKDPGDLDVATNATPDQVEKLFAQTVAVGKAFGVIRVISEGHSIEVATYRHDLEYRDGRRPVGVEFTNRVEDAKRRDFTVNALFFDPVTEVLYDDVAGQADLQRKLLRCVGDAGQRFHEDELRRLRLVRFVSQLGFSIEPQTRQALEVGLEGLHKISRERITEEIGKMWKGPYLQQAFSEFRSSGMAERVDPAWKSIETPPDEIWTLPRTDKFQQWAHYFSFFFEEKELKSHFKLYKLPKEIEKFVEKTHQAYQAIPDFLKLSEGQRRFDSAQPGFIEGLQFYIVKRNQPALRNLLSQIKAQPALPEPLIRAQHIQDRFQGAELGLKLKAVYIEQLQRSWTRVEEALHWLSQNRT